jgi:predicted amidohydrolase
MNGEAVHMDCVGLIQMTSGPVPEQNLDYLEHEVAKCKTLGAKWVVCPENALVFGNKADYHQYAEPLNNGPLQLKL